jgi:mycothiol S-conjugate amidase
MLEPRTLLGVFAHPDDESFGPGGTLSRYAANGVHVHVIIGTDGDAGSIETSHKRQEGRTLAQERQEELALAALALGVTTITNLPYRDSGMRGSPDNANPRSLLSQPVESLIDEMVGYIRRLRPQVILTHDPFGGYGHPDHIRLCEATTAAFYLAGDAGYQSQEANGASIPYSPQKLYYTTFDKTILRWALRIMYVSGQNPRALGRNRDINLEEICSWHTPVSARINILPYLEQKNAASRAHASQYSGGPTFLRVFPEFIRRRFIGKESFMRAYPAPTSALIEDDLFAGVRLKG